MKIECRKAATICFLSVLVWLAYSGRPIAAQVGSETYHVTQVDSRQLSDASSYPSIGGNVQIPGKEVKGFSCVADVDGDLDKGDGRISSDVKCYVLSK
jgi:hypothetical protein